MKTMFAKRHYEAVALAAQESLRLAKDSHEAHGVWIMVQELADVFARNSGLFKRDRFLAACQPGANVYARTNWTPIGDAAARVVKKAASAFVMVKYEPDDVA